MIDLLIRKIIHILFGLTLYIMIQIYGKQVQFIFLLIAAFFIIFDIGRYKLKSWGKIFYSAFGKLLKEDEKRNNMTGATLFVLIAAVVIVLFPPHIAKVSILIITFSDSFASIAGQIFPIFTIWKTKSLSGSLAFFLTSVFILDFSFQNDILYLLFVAIIITCIELFADVRFENFLVGLVSATLIYFLL